MTLQLLKLPPAGLAGQLRGLGREAEAAGGEDEGGAGEAAGGHGGAVELLAGGGQKMTPILAAKIV